MPESRKITYAQAIHEALDQSMKEDNSVFIIGEGVPDPKGIFGTTLGLKQKYHNRVLDMPISENGMTGVCIGAALAGMRPVLVHQRMDFSLLAIDQLVNNAAKWHYMFAGKKNVPMVIRMIIGMGWGQGPQHSQNLQAIFAHIPGLKVVMPTTAYDAKGLLIASIRDNNPIVFIEHRWLHNIVDNVPQDIYTVPLGKSRILREGKDITVVATSYMNIEALKTADILKEHRISAELIDIRTLRPLDDDPIIESVKKTGHLLVLDSGYYTGGFAAEIIARVTEKVCKVLKSAPQRITLPDIPTPTTQALTKYYYPRYTDIAKKILEMLGKKEIKLSFRESSVPSDIPDESFKGPF